MPDVPRAAVRSPRRPATLFLVLSIATLAAASGAVLAAESQAAGQATPRLVVQAGHLRSPVWAAAYLPDGRTVFMSRGTTLHLWEADSGREIRRFSEDRVDIRAVTVSVRGTIGAAAGDRSVRLWNLATGRAARRFDWNVASGPNSIRFSPVGDLLAMGSKDGNVSVREPGTGREILRLKAHAGAVAAVAFSRDGRHLFSGGQDKMVRQWEISSGRLVRDFVGHEEGVIAISVSHDGRMLASAGRDNTVRLWDVKSARETRASKYPYWPGSVAFCPTGNRLVASSGNLAYVVDPVAEAGATSLSGHQYMIHTVALSPDCRYAATAGDDGSARVWDAATGAEVARFEPNVEPVDALAVSADEGHVLVGGNRSARLWDLSAGGESRRLQYRDSVEDYVSSVSFCSPDGRNTVVGLSRRGATVWDAVADRIIGIVPGTYAACEPGTGMVLGQEDGTVLQTSLPNVFASRVIPLRPKVTAGRHAGPVRAVAISSGRRHFLTTSMSDAPRLWNYTTGEEIRQFTGHNESVLAIAFSPDGQQVLTGSSDRTARMWEAGSGRFVREFKEHKAAVRAVAFSPDGRRIVTGSDDGIVRLWSAAGDKPPRLLRGHDSGVNSAAFLRNGRFLLTGGADGTTRLWRTDSGEEVASLMSFRNQGWAVVAPDGRFDTDNLEEVRGLHWVMPDEPFRAFPIELYMREYYEPRLLARILSGEKFSPIRTPAALNRAIPGIRILDVRPEDPASDAGSGGETQTVSVAVEVSVPALATGRERASRAPATSVHDLRLYRDGRLVGQAPAPSPDSAGTGAGSGTELQQWRQTTRLGVEPVSEKTSFMFRGIRLPREKGRQAVTFSAYAFNSDRVKSITAIREFPIPGTITPREPKAYVVTIGVNAFETEARKYLRFAARDAERLGTLLEEQLRTAFDVGVAVSRYAEVVPVTLTSDMAWDRETGMSRVSPNDATKAKIEAVLRKLAGHEVDMSGLKGIRNVERLAPARPEDFVVIAMSSHGEVDEQGEFYIMPYDIGPSDAGAAIRKRAISTADLSNWLRGLEAAEAVLIIDACYAAAAVGGKNFKAGPMGSRGLGQLAYDKRMRVLVAAESAELAGEAGGMGLLTRSLVVEGLQGDGADYRPQDRQIFLGEWLSYAVRKVPELYDDLRKGKAEWAKDVSRHSFTDIPQELQHPALFDYSRGRDVVLKRLRRPD